MDNKFKNNMKEINENIRQAEILLKEAMNFCEDDDMDMMAPETEEEIGGMEGEMPQEEMVPQEAEAQIDSYVDHIRKYSLNGLSALCDNPESEEYQMLKKIFQMCDKKPEKKDGMTESRRLFGIMKENKEVVFEVNVENPKEFKNLQRSMVNEAIMNGYNPSDIRLVSENKIIR